MIGVNAEKLAVWRTRLDYQAAALGGICTFIALLLMIGQIQTKDAIALRLEEDRQAMLAQVLPAQYFDNEPLKNSVVIDDPVFASESTTVFLATMQNKLTALVFQLSTEGYGGTITLLMAVSVEGDIIGLRTLSHKETPGLADAIEISKSDWITVFNGLSLANTPRDKWAVKKDGGQFDQFTGATITPRAIVSRVVEGLDFHARNASAIATQAEKDKQHD